MLSLSVREAPHVDDPSDIKELRKGVPDASPRDDGWGLGWRLKSLETIDRLDFWPMLPFDACFSFSSTAGAIVIRGIFCLS